jgi:peroxiredoxin
MIKLLSTIFIALLLTACGSQENSEDTSLKTEIKNNTTPSTLEELQEKVTAKVDVEKASKTEEPKVSTKGSTQEAPATPSQTYAKNIFTLTTLEGKELHVDEAEEGIIFQEHKGKVVFLLFFGFKCPPCLAEIPVLKAMTNEKHKDMEIIAIEVQRLPSESLKSFKANKGINYTLLSGDEGQNSKFISYIGQRAQWGGSIPFLVALNPKGEVKVVHVGGMGSTQFKAIYDKIRLEK